MEEKENGHVTRKGASAVSPIPLRHAHDPSPSQGHAVGKDEDVLGRARPVGFRRTTELGGHPSDVVGRHLQDDGHRQDADHHHVEGIF